MASVNESLLILARDVRSRTLTLLDAAHPSELTWAPPGTSNHLLWHAGHALWLQEVLGLRLITERRGMREDWEELFRMESQPNWPPRPWPQREELRQALVLQLEQACAAVTPLTDVQLDARQPVPRGSGGRSLRQSLIHGWHDEACHQGEMYLLLKMLRK